MRRIPRPQRSIDQALSLRPRIASSPCRSALATTPCLRTNSASFSTSTHYNSILSGKQDKKKHQQFVRKWQKRLLGDSEPIGAHVDPYDATSPVRIALEETGEEQEVLAEARLNEDGSVEEGPYYKAESGEGLQWVGTKRWIAEQKERELETRFRKLMGRSSYPRTYYRSIRFGREDPVTELDNLRKRFHQAIVEIYTLREAGLDTDLFSPKGMYSPEFSMDFPSVKLQYSPTDGVSLHFSEPGDRANLLRNIQEGLGRDATKQVPEELVDEAEELVVEEGEAAAADVTDAKASGKEGAAVKQTESKPFDFMSNRPVPRAKAEEPLAEAVETVAPVVEIDLESATEASQNTVHAIEQEILDTTVSRGERKHATSAKELRTNVESVASESITVSESVVDAKYRHIPLTDPALKFSLSKRLTKLTGLRISDPNLNSSHTLGDLYANLVAASKPKPKKLYDMIQVEHEAKLKASYPLASTEPMKQGAYYMNGKKYKPGMEQLMSLPNVTLYEKRVSPADRDRQVGRKKVIDYALMERGLSDVGIKDGRAEWLRRERRMEV